MNAPAAVVLYPALAGVCIACALGTAREPRLDTAALAAVVAVLVLAWATVPARGPLAPYRSAVLAALVGVAVGGASALAWAQRADAWTPRLGERVVVEGVLDGRRLRIAGSDDLLLRGIDPAVARVRVRGVLEPLAERRNPGGFDEAGFWWRRDVRVALRVEAIDERHAPSGMLAVRVRLRDGVRAGLSEGAAALQQALTLGVRDDLGGLRPRFAAAGMAHLLALSGLHVGVLAAVVMWCARPLGRRRAGVVVLAVVALYVAVVGASPSVVRAAVMLAFVVATRALGVVAAPLPATLASAALALLLARPAWVGDLAFQLSFASVAGIALLAGPALERAPTQRPAPGEPRSRQLARRLAGWAGIGVRTSAAAQLATLSLVADSFGAVPLLAPLVNLVAVPLGSALVPLGAVAGLAGIVHPELAVAVNRLSEPLARALIGLADAAARLPALPWGEVGAEGHALVACALLALAAAARGLMRWRSAVAVLACGASVSLALPEAQPTPELVVLDVGQGDAIVLRLGGGRGVLIDAGGIGFGGFDAGARVVVPALRALGVWRLEALVITHADLDHVGGAPAVLMALSVGEVWFGHAEPERPAWQALERAAAQRAVPLRSVQRGQRAHFGDVTIEVLHPTPLPSGDGNADSVALLLRVRDMPWALLLGDVPKRVEADLPVPPTPLLLAPHHGSATSTGDALLRSAQPSVALVSAGGNRYGHPAPEVLERLAAAGVGVLVTREHGALRSHPWRECVRVAVHMWRPGAPPAAAC